MVSPKIAVVSFPGNNCEFESLRALAQSGIEPMFFRWNDDRARLAEVDGYFIPGGFSYEDRGRSGMVAGRDSLMDFIAAEAAEGKVVIGNCNGAQILIESGLVPLDKGLRMSLARNAITTNSGYVSPGFLSEWVWITVSCSQDRCATSSWEGVMHLPIAHGEGRFTTSDKDVITALNENDQIAFSYCDAAGNVSMDPVTTPNGSMYSIAGICNPAGNVVALMPHPERTPNGKPYFDALRRWIETNGRTKKAALGGERHSHASMQIPIEKNEGTEVFIETIIVNNEERTVEQTARRLIPTLRLKQWKYFRTLGGSPRDILADLTIFNANKERAYIRKQGRMLHWDHAKKEEHELLPEQQSDLFSGIAILRTDVPETGENIVGSSGKTGICYLCRGVEEEKLFRNDVLEVFSNPHASRLVRLNVP